MNDELQAGLLDPFHEAHEGILLLNYLKVSLFLLVYVLPEVVHLLPDQMHHLHTPLYTLACFSYSIRAMFLSL